jgi:hypothetical protein
MSPSAQVDPGDDEFVPASEGWSLAVADHHLVATASVPFEGDRVVTVRLGLPAVGGAEIEGLLQRVTAAVAQAKQVSST